MTVLLSDKPEPVSKVLVVGVGVLGWGALGIQTDQTGVYSDLLNYVLSSHVCMVPPGVWVM